MALTQESVLSFLLERGGRVKNAELLNSFRGRISCGDPAERQHNRDLFKTLVNSVAVVKQVGEVTFVVVKKRYQDFAREVTRDASQMEDGLWSPNTSPSHASPRRAESARTVYSDNENNDRNGNAEYTSAGRIQQRTTDTNMKVLIVPGDQASRARRSGAVFAVIAVKSPPRHTEPQEGLLSRVHQQKTSHEPTTLVTKVSAPSQPALDSPACKKDALSYSQCWKSRHTEDMQPPGVPQARPQNKSTRGDDAKYLEPGPLEPLAHEWLVKCAAGLWGRIYGLLLQDTRLAHRKDFMSGFTALHWAAKDGNSEMIHKLVDVSRRRGACVDVNSTAHGGYTPLHVAAIHGHTEAMVSLVQSYGANVNKRDNDGKKAFHYLGEGVSAEVRALLGGLQRSRCGEKTEDGEYREPPKSFNTISKLFQPHTGKKQKATAKFARDW